MFFLESLRAGFVTSYKPAICVKAVGCPGSGFNALGFWYRDEFVKIDAPVNTILLAQIPQHLMESGDLLRLISK